nr:putative ribonuclease H-like domain-containing protein [Tanacetum cinerariifolium]
MPNFLLPFGLKQLTLLVMFKIRPYEESNTQVPEGSGNPNPTVSSSNPPADQMKTLKVESPIPTVSSPVPTAYLNDSLELSNEARLISKRVANQEETPSPDNILSLTNRFKDILGVSTSSDERIGVEADTDPALLQCCLFSCFLSQVEPKKVFDALQDPSWVEAMPEELLQFKIQNVWTLVDCPKGVRPIGAKWVLKNKKDARGIVVRNKARLNNPAESIITLHSCFLLGSLLRVSPRGDYDTWDGGKTTWGGRVEAMGTVPYTRRIQELLMILQETCPSLTELGTKLVAVTPKNKTKQIRPTEQITKSGKTTVTTPPSANLDSNTPVLSSTRVIKAKKNKVEDHLRTVKSCLNKKSVVDSKATSSVINSVSNVNSDLKCASCNGCLFFDNHDACVVDYIKCVNASRKSKSVKTTVKRKVWKPTGNVFKTLRHIWKPTRRTFKLVGNVCPLTRIATPIIMPPREPIPIVNSMDKPVVTLVYTRKPKAANKKVPNKLEPNNSWGSSSSNVPFSLLTCRLSKSSSGTWTPVAQSIRPKIALSSSILYKSFLARLNLGMIMWQFCDSDLEVAFHQHTCFIHNLDGVDLLIGSQGNNLYTLSLQDMMASSPICLLSKASKTKSWLWHHRLSHLNFGAINHLSRQGLVRGLPKLKFEKDHHYSACAMGKSTKKTYKPKSKDTNQEKLYL